MSYCVNCGVELDDSAKKCALCSTPVINPNALIPPEEAVPPFPTRVVIPAEVRRRYGAFIASMVFLIPNIVCLVINLLFNFGYLWATYLNATSALVWLLLVFPFLFMKPKSYIIVPIDAVGVFLYTAVFYAVEHGHGWLFELALPLILVVAAFAFSVAEWIKHKKLDWPILVTSLLLQTAVVSFGIELIFRYYYNLSLLPVVSIIIAVCCLALVAFFLSVLKNKRLRAWLSRKFFI